MIFLRSNGTTPRRYADAGDPLREVFRDFREVEGAPTARFWGTEPRWRELRGRDLAGVAAGGLPHLYVLVREAHEMETPVMEPIPDDYPGAYQPLPRP